MTATIITPWQAALLIWLGGAAWCSWTIYQWTEKLAERNCVCQRPMLHSLSSMMTALPEPFGALTFAGTLLVVGLLWPGMIAYRPVARWRRRHDPRCEHCGMRLPARANPPRGN